MRRAATLLATLVAGVAWAIALGLLLMDHLNLGWIATAGLLSLLAGLVAGALELDNTDDHY